MSNGSTYHGRLARAYGEDTASCAFLPKQP